MIEDHSTSKIIKAFKGLREKYSMTYIYFDGYDRGVWGKVTMWHSGHRTRNRLTSLTIYISIRISTRIDRKQNRNDTKRRPAAYGAIGPKRRRYLDINTRYVHCAGVSQSCVSTSSPFTMRSMLFRSDAGGVVAEPVVVELGASGGGSAEAARAGGDPGLGRAGDELRLRARGATCSNADPRPGSA